MDSYSRYVLGVQGMHRPTFEGTKAAFEALFEQYGLPEQIHTDNGEPFGGSSMLALPSNNAALSDSTPAAAFAVRERDHRTLQAP
jgi:transposase InsO family protein